MEMLQYQGSVEFFSEDNSKSSNVTNPVPLDCIDLTKDSSQELPKYTYNTASEDVLNVAAKALTDSSSSEWNKIPTADCVSPDASIRICLSNGSEQKLSDKMCSTLPLLSEKESVSGSESVTEPKIVPEQESASGSESVSGPKVVQEPDIISGSERVPEPKIVPEQESASGSERVSGPKVVPEPDNISGSESVPEPKVTPEPERVSGSEILPVPEIVHEPEIVPEAVEPDKKMEIENSEEPLKSDRKPPPERVSSSMKEMQQLSVLLPELDIFNLHRKVGEGTFSRVFLASLRERPEQRFALKYHIPTAHPARIEWELKCLQHMGGVDNVIGVKCALRKLDCTVFVLPYVPHKRFSEMVMEMGVAESRHYIRGLLIALARVHSFSIIHRDVKPSNYLYNRETKECLLIDFGLASESAEVTPNSPHAPLRMNPNLVNIDKRSSSIKRKREATPSEPPTKRRALQPKPDEGNLPQPQAARGTDTEPTYRAAVKKKLFANNENKMAESEVTSTKLGSLMQPRVTMFAAPDDKTYLRHKENMTMEMMRTPGRDGAKFTGGGGIMQQRDTLMKTPQGVRGLMQAREAKTPGSTMVKAQGFRGMRSPAYATPRQVLLNPGGGRGRTPQETATSEVEGGGQRRGPATPGSAPKFQNLTPTQKTGTSYVRVQDSQVKSSSSLFVSPSTSRPICLCYGKPVVCEVCMARPTRNVCRAGTPGFRPPEVLFKVEHQTTAVDIWAAGVVFLCLISGSYPFFKSPNDTVSLAEITILFGSDKVKEVANILERQVLFSNPKKALNLRKLCEALRRRRHNPLTREGCPQCPVCCQFIDPKEGCICEDLTVTPQPGTSASGGGKWGKGARGGLKRLVDMDAGDGNEEKEVVCDDRGVGEDVGEEEDDNVFPASAYDLLKRLLDLNPYTRITAKDALKHPFFDVGPYAGCTAGETSKAERKSKP